MITESRKQKAESRNNQGFTLMELIVAMAILAILTTGGLSTYIRSLMRGRDAQRKADLGQVQRALEAYFNDKGQYPASNANGQIAVCGASDCEWGKDAFEDKAVEGGAIYMKLLPKDPVVNQRYFYQATNGVSYQLYAKLENTEDQQAKADGFGVDCGNNVICNYGVSSSNTVP